MKSRDNILLALLVLLSVWCAGYAYYRFMVVDDYAIAYQGACDPATHSCFVGCNDSTSPCTDKNYYTKVQKYAVDLYAQCGKDITDCAAANICLPQNDRGCSITFCDQKIDGDVCETSLGEQGTSSEKQASSGENGIQQGIASTTKP